MIGRWQHDGIGRQSEVDDPANRAVLQRLIEGCAGEIARLTTLSRETRLALTAQRREWRSLMRKAEKIGLTVVTKP